MKAKPTRNEGEILLQVNRGDEDLLEAASCPTHARTGLKHALFGSVAEDVVRKAPCPVLVVREREREILGD